MDEQLLFDALNEIAEALGESNYNPISTSLLCLRSGITFEEKGKVMMAFNQVLNEVPFDDLDIECFREAMKKVVPGAKDYADEVIIAYIKGFARNHIAELVPFARTLD